jgi:hypothetical protein
LVDTHSRGFHVIGNPQFFHDEQYIAIPDTLSENNNPLLGGNETFTIICWGLRSNHPFWLMYPFFQELPHYLRRVASLSGSLGSEFLFMTNTFVHAPTNRTHGQLIINPRNATVYALDNKLYYASSLLEERMVVPVAVRVVGSDADAPTGDETRNNFPEFVPCLVDSRFVTIHIPEIAFGQLIAQLENVGVRLEMIPTNPDIARFFVHNVTDANIDLLPSVQFFVRTDQEERVSIATLSPRDYLGPEIMLDTARSVRPFWVRIGSSLSSKLLNTIVVHMDGINRRIGFGEPLNEIP